MKVAIICASRIGDFLCATPAFRAVRAWLPGAEISLIAMPFVEPLVERSPHLDRHISFPGFPGMAAQFFNPARALDFFARMQNERFDLAIQMHGSGVYSNPVALMLGARRTVGFIREEDSPGLLDAALEWPSREPARLRALRLAEFLGAPSRGEHTEFPLCAGDRQAAAKAMAGAAEPWIGLHAGAREPGKRWPLTNFAALAEQLPAGTLFLLGGPDEVEASAQLASLIGPRAVSFAGRFSLPEMGAAIEALDLLVTNDSAPAHIAYALATPSVTLFGETDPDEWGPPPGGPHKIAVAKDRVIASLSVDVVAEAAAAAIRT